MTDIERLWAERCAGRVPAVYARGIDRRDWDLVRSCFAEDAFVDGSRTALPIEEYLPTLRAGVEYYPSTMHLLGNQLVELAADGRSGHVETYAVAYHWRGDSPGAPHEQNLVLGVRYDDDMRLEPDGVWEIVHRAVSADWRTGPFPAL